MEVVSPGSRVEGIGAGSGRPPVNSNSRRDGLRSGGINSRITSGSRLGVVDMELGKGLGF